MANAMDSYCLVAIVLSLASICNPVASQILDLHDRFERAKLRSGDANSAFAENKQFAAPWQGDGAFKLPVISISKSLPRHQARQLISGGDYNQNRYYACTWTKSTNEYGGYCEINKPFLMQEAPTAYAAQLYGDGSIGYPARASACNEHVLTQARDGTIVPDDVYACISDGFNRCTIEWDPTMRKPVCIALGSSVEYLAYTCDGSMERAMVWCDTLSRGNCEYYTDCVDLWPQRYFNLKDSMDKLAAKVGGLDNVYAFGSCVHSSRLTGINSNLPWPQLIQALNASMAAFQSQVQAAAGSGNNAAYASLVGTCPAANMRKLDLVSTQVCDKHNVPGQSLTPQTNMSSPPGQNITTLAACLEDGCIIGYDRALDSPDQPVSQPTCQASFESKNHFPFMDAPDWLLPLVAQCYGYQARYDKTACTSISVDL